MISRARRLLTGLAALAALAVAVIGLPVVLFRFGGSPLPAHLASLHHVGTVLTSRDNGSLLLAVIRDCSWLAWLLFTVCVLAEAQAALRGRRAPQLRLGGVQNTAAYLVALAALSFAAPASISLAASAATVSSLPGPAVADPSQEVLLMAAPQNPDLHPAGQPQPDAAGPRPADARPETQAGAQDGARTDAPAEAETDALELAPAHASRLITVRPGDCLWTIAQRYLGAGDRYPEIVSLNDGHSMGDGQVFTNPALIEPGWQLFLPGDGGAGAATGSGTAGHHLGHGSTDSYYQRRHPAARTRTAQERSAHQAGNVAATPDASPPARAGGTAGASGAAQAGDQLAGAPAGYRTTASPDSSGDQLPEAAVFITGALAGAVLTSLSRLRRGQRQARRRGRRIALPAETAVLAAEQRLRATAPAEPLATLRDALSCLEGGITGSGQELPDIVGLHVTPDLLEVLLAEPAAAGPPAPYAISPGRQGMCWQLDLPAVTAGSPDGPGPAAEHGLPVAGMVQHGCHLLAGLVTAGATTDGYLLLDLEALRVTGCDGPAELIDQVVSTAATELATGQWSGWYELILVGCDELEPLGRAEHCATFGDALALLESRSAVVAPRVAQRAPADMRELRLAEPDNEDWSLTILVSRVEPAPDELQRLLELAEDGPGGIAAFVAGDAETGQGRMAPTVLQLANDPAVPGGILANVVPLQITVRPRALSAADYEAVATLFTVAADTDDVSRDSEPYAMYAAPPWIPQAATLEPVPAVADLVWPGPGPAGAPAGPDAGGYLATDLESAGSQAEGHEPAGYQAAGDEEAGILRVEAGRRAPDDGAGEVVPADGQWAGPADYRLAGHPAGSAGAGPEWAADHPSGPIRVTGLGAADAAGFRPAGRHEAVAQPVQVKILGPFIIAGAAGQLQPKQAELVLALALAAPAGLSNSALCSLLGPDPDHAKPSDAVRQIITRTRRRLGLAPDGQEYVIHAGSGHYILHPGVSLDWSLFRQLVASGRADDLRAAVALINGQPFTGSYFWWIDIPLMETVRAELVDAAETLSEFELAIGSPRAAARAARAGLLAEASAEQLWRSVMRAEHAAGNLAGVTEAWRRCLDAIEEVAPGGEPHPDTETLYRQLTMAARQRAPVR